MLQRLKEQDSEGISFALQPDESGKQKCSVLEFHEMPGNGQRYDDTSSRPDRTKALFVGQQE